MNPTLIGILAPLGWSLIPLISFYLNSINPILLTSIVLFIFFLIDLLRQLITKSFQNPFNIPLNYYLLGIVGITGFHIFYFSALQLAPIIIVFLIINLAGILNIIYSKLFYNIKIRYKHIAAILINFSAIILIIFSKSIDKFEKNHLIGYCFAFLAANCWSFYTVKNKSYIDIPIGNIIYICFLSAIITLLIYFLQHGFEFPIINLNDFVILILLAIYPIGYSIFFWIYGVKYGDIRILSIFSYLSPILGSLWLIIAGIEAFHWYIIISLTMIVISGLILKLVK